MKVSCPGPGRGPAGADSALDLARRVRGAERQFYTNHRDELEEADFRPLLDIWDVPVQVLVPIVVVNELDGLKIQENQTRWRASYTLAVLDCVFVNSAERAPIRRADPSSRGGGHHRDRL